MLTVTKRRGGIDIIVDALKRQTFTGSWEWILVDELFNERNKEVQDFVKSQNLTAQFTHIPPKTPTPKRKFGLCNAINSAFLQSRGELLVSIQDFIWVEPTCLDRYWKAYDAFPNRLIGGLKNHYSGPPATNLQGLVSIWDTPWEGDPAVKCKLTERDDRYKSIHAEPEAVLVESLPIVYEMCNASMPYTLTCALNGVDESYDSGRSYDNQNISFRAQGLGYATVIDMYNIAREFNHWEYFGVEDKVSSKSLNNRPHPDTNYELHGRLMQAIQRGDYPLRAPNNFELGPR